MKHGRRSFASKPFSRVALVAACLLALSAFVVASTMSEKKDNVDIAPPQATAQQGPRLSVGDVVSFAAVEPVKTVAARDLPPPVAWQPGEAIREIPRRTTRNEDWVPPIPADEAWGIDPLAELQQKFSAEAPSKVFTTPDINVPGAGFTGVNPPDTNGDVGPNHFVQMINGAGTRVTVYDKTGAQLSQFSLTGLGGCSTGSGDPIVLYDDAADRWMLSEFGAGNSLCVFVSQTPDPLGAYFSYQFATPGFPDYPKYGVWPDAYYVGSNEASPAAYALDRVKMLAGLPATSQRFTIPDLAGFGFQMLIPAHADGATPPPGGRKNVFMRQRDDEVHNAGSNNPAEDYLELWEFTLDWVTPANSSIVQLPQIPVAEFSSELCGLFAFACVPMPGTATTLDPLREVIMFGLQYRNHGSHEALIGNYVVDSNNTDHHAVRWFELRSVGGGAWTLHQEGTYGPDSDHRWMASIAQDQEGNIALGYSVSSSTTSPSMRYTGRLASDPLGVMTQAETTIIAGTGNNASNRWGDYSSMWVDPTDDCTFWHTNMYTDGSGVWNTQVATFKFDACGEPGISFSGSPLSQQVCAPGGNLSTADINLTVGSIQGYTDPADLDFGALPAGFSGIFTVDPVVPPGVSVAEMTLSGVADGLYMFDITATPPLPADPRQITATIEVFTTAPGATTLLTPTDTETGVSTVSFPFSWTAVPGTVDYFVEVSTDPGFGSIFASGTFAATTVNGTNFPPATTFYWRVTPNNPCGPGTTSTVFSFTTANTTQLTLGDDATTEVALPFGFNFCGTVYNTLWVNSNGSVSFGAGDTDLSESVVDLIQGPPNPGRIAMLWDDLHPGQGGSVLTEVTGGGDFRVTFNSVPEWNAGNSNTFSVLLRPNGTFQLDYPNLDALDGLVGHAFPGANNGGETDLSAATQPIGGPVGDALYEIFTASDNDLSGTTLEFAACIAAQIAPAQPGVLYGSLGLQGDGDIITIDPVTGVGTLVGPGISDGVPGLAIDSSGAMFGTYGGPSGDLYRIDAATGAAFFIGPTGLEFLDGIAFDENDVLYGVGKSGGGLPSLYTINPLTGSTTLVAGPLTDYIVGLAFDPSDGTLYASVGGSGGGGPVVPQGIYTLDKGTGVLTPVGVTGVGAHEAIPDLAFVDGDLFGVTTIGAGATPSTLIAIDKLTGMGTVVGTDTGFVRVSGLAVKPPVCGDGLLDLEVGEECDDGNLIDGDGCQSTCLLPVCGDGVVDPGEQCEPPNTMTCDASCQFAVDVITPGDDGAALVPLPFAFPFCGTSYNSVYVNGNGNLTFGAASADFSESVAEFLSQPPRIAGLWDDLNPPAGMGLVTTSTIGADFHISFSNVPEFSNTGSNTFTFILRPDGTHSTEYGAISATDGLAGRSAGNGEEAAPAETDLSAAAQPIGFNQRVVYQLFGAGDPNDLDFLTLDYEACPPKGNLVLGDDDSLEVPLPFAFPFCGIDYNSVFVGSNGFLTFGIDDTDLSESVTDLLQGPPRIAGMWDDLAPNEGGTVTGNAVGGNYEVQFTNVPEWFAGNNNTFKYTLRPDGTYQLAYGTVDAPDGLVGRSKGGGESNPGETDLSAALQPIGTGAATVYELFSASDNDLDGLVLEFDACPLDQPVIQLVPLSLSSTQPTNSSTGHPMTLSNVGTQDLVWDVNEAATMAPEPATGGVKVQPKRSGGSKIDPQFQGITKRLGPTAPNEAALAAKLDQDEIQGSRANVLPDGGFESGTPNASWAEASTNFGTPICDVGSCGTGGGTGPNSGDFWSWFGGIAAFEEGSVSQTLVIPADATELTFELEVPACGGSAGDFMELTIDGNQEFLVDATSALCGVIGYSTQTVDITAYADGGSHTVEFHSIVNGVGTTNFFVDDVVIDSPSFVLPGCDNPTAIPWLSLTPVISGTTTPGADTALLATMDSTGLSNGLYEALLCFNSNDPATPLVEVPVTLIVADTPPTGAFPCNGPAENFNAGIPATWTTVDNEGDGVVWESNGFWGEGNYTGGTGGAAMVCSDCQGTAEFDAELITPPFDLAGFTNAELTYKANYHNFAALDFLDVDISTNGGGSWTNLLSWNEDHGGFFATPGENVTIDLSAYAGQTGLLIRYRYHDPNSGDFDWYAQVDDVRLTCSGALPTPKMESNTVPASGAVQTINLVNSYVDPVVVATVQYNNNTKPVVTRVSNVTSTSFDLRLQNPGDGSPVQPDNVHYWVVESGVWLFDGVKIEARTYLSTTTKRKGLWGAGDSQTYGQNYVTPVVFAQVMTENDPRWSYAFVQGLNHLSPPTSTVLQTGKHIGEDTAHERANEVVGYIVIDAVHTTIGGVEVEAAIGLDTIAGVVNGAPHQYTFNNPFGTAPSTVVTTSAGIDGGDGAWAQVHGPTAATTTLLNLSVDEDQITDAERSHTDEQVNYIAFAGPLVFPIPPACSVDADCDDGIFCNGAESCNAGSCLLGVNPCPGLGCSEVADVCVAGATAQMESVTAVAGGLAPATVPLANSYLSPVIACTTVYDNNTKPVVVRIDNVTSNSFDVRLQNPGDLAPVVADTVHCLVVEEGSWMMDGHKVEAVKYDSTITDKEYNWLGAFQTLTHTFTNPVVLGQVMSSNDPLWSYYWQQGTARTAPPSSTALRNGKTVGEDPNVVRATETIGYIVFEQSNGTLGGVTFEARLGVDTIVGIDNAPPKKYTFNVPFAAPPQSVIATQAGMDGSDGSWAYLYGSAFATATQLSLAVDEDQIFNAERSHSTEQVGYVAFETPVLFPQVGCAIDGDCDDGNFCNGVESCNAGTCQAGSAVVCDDGVGCTDDSCNEGMDGCEFTPNDAHCDNGLYCDGAETCDPVADCQVGSDPCGGDTCDEGNDTCPGAGPVAQAEWGTVVAGGPAAVTVPLTHTYVDPVIVTSLEYLNNTTPVVTRISSVTATSFDVYLQNPSGGPVNLETVSYFVVEKGTWTIGGVKIEAQKYLSTTTAHDGDWNQFDAQVYGQAYTNPAVLGQVMSNNDLNFSAFWSRGSARTAPPSAASLGTGKMVGEDPNTVRADEVIGFIVVEGGHGFFGGTEYECKVGTDSVAGVVNAPPFLYTFSTSFPAAPAVSVVTQTAMDGFNGGWMYTYGPAAASTTKLRLAGDEDQLLDAERSRTTESAAYCVFQTAGAYP